MFHTIIDSSINTQTLVLSQTIGLWEDETSYRISPKLPVEVRSLETKLTAIEQELANPCDLTDWAQATAGMVHLVEGSLVSEKPPAPSGHHTFNWESKQWEDPRTLSEIKAAQWALVKDGRSQAEFGQFTYNDMVFDGDLDAQRRLASYISIGKGALASNLPFQAGFTLVNNTEVMLTAADFVLIEMAKVTQVAAAFAQARRLREQIDAATTQAEVEAITWSEVLS
jgi:hypothetical protein